MNKSIIKNIKPLGFTWETQDPFLFCAYHRDQYPMGNSQMGVNHEALKGRNIGQDFNKKDGWSMYHGSEIPGFPYHPHRGFETITINKEGVVDHSDSLGAAGRFMAGDVQWMTAASGVLHKEFHETEWSKAGGEFQMVQLWVNLPAKDKMSSPKYQAISNATIPKVIVPNNGGLVEVIAGNYNEHKGAAFTFSPINMLNVLACWRPRCFPTEEEIRPRTFPKRLRNVSRALLFVNDYGYETQAVETFC